MTRRRAVALTVALVFLTAGACGGGGGEDPGDEASFCRLADEEAPVAEADSDTLGRLAELAPVEVRDQVAVLLDLATQVDEAGAGSADALAIEFEVRFSDEYIAARRDVEAYQRTECRAEVARVTTTSTTGDDGRDATSTTSTTSTDDTTDTTGGDDG